MEWFLGGNGKEIFDLRILFSPGMGTGRYTCFHVDASVSDSRSRSVVIELLKARNYSHAIRLQHTSNKQ
jgi:hypothetical protein